MNSDEKLRKIIEERAKRHKTLEIINEMRSLIDRHLEDGVFFDFTGDGPLLMEEQPAQSATYSSAEPAEGEGADNDDDDRNDDDDSYDDVDWPEMVINRDDGNDGNAD